MAVTIDKDQVRQRVAAGALLIEVLPAKEYEQEHLPHAISLPLTKLIRQTTAPFAHDRPIIVYCYDYQ